MPCIVTMDLVVDYEYFLTFSRANSVLNRKHKRQMNILRLKQVKHIKNGFCLTIIIELVDYPNHTILQNYNSLKVSVIS